MRQAGGTRDKGDSKDDNVGIIVLPDVVSDALNKAKAKAAAETEEAREGDAPHAQTAMATSQPRNMEEEEELRMPGSFDFGYQGGGGAVGEMPGAGTVNPFDAVGMLGNLWRRM